jgi:hypothetical protein
MSFIFQRDQVNSIMLTVLKLSGGIPNYPADYTQPQIRISHINGGAEVEDLTYTGMTYVPSSNRWFYKYTISHTASFTKYLVTFKTVIQGITTLATEEYKVVPLLPSSGPGEFDIQMIIEDEITHSPIAGATIQIYDMSNPNVLLATDTSDSAGLVNVYLNAGTYLANFIKPGDVSEAHTLVVNSDGTYIVRGN